MDHINLGNNCSHQAHKPSGMFNYWFWKPWAVARSTLQRLGIWGIESQILKTSAVGILLVFCLTKCCSQPFIKWLACSIILALFNSLPIAMSKLAGVGKLWWQNPSIQSRLNQFGGIDGLVTKREGLALAAKDRWHCLINRDILEPVFAAMFNDRLIKTPSMEPITVQVHVLDLLWQNSKTKGEKIPIDETNLPPIPEEKELTYHLAVASIKGLVLFVRKHRLRPHVPRDTGWKKMVSMLKPVSIKTHSFFILSPGFLS